MIKSITFFLIFFYLGINAQIYKGMDLTKEQKKELKNICKKHSRSHDVILVDYIKKTQNLKYEDSLIRYKFRAAYKFKKDSIDGIVNQEMATVFNDNQKKIFWERIKKLKSNQ